MKDRLTSKRQVAHLLHEAKRLGATSAAIIPSKEIQVKESLAELCNGEYSCPNYGFSANCPPHVEGPAEFRKWRAKSRYAIAVKVELPTSAMFSGECKGVMQRLHKIVAAVERKAIESGLEKSRAFAGGSCKDLFCGDRETCRVLSEDKSCRHTATTRPSMSGFGIDVAQLMLSSGWPAPKAEKSNLSDKDPASWVAGLILLA